MSERDRRICERKTCQDTWIEVQEVRKIQQSKFTETEKLTKVKIDNISASGACIISEKPFELDQILKFRDSHINQTGRVVWTCQSKIECKAGIQFDPIDG